MKRRELAPGESVDLEVTFNSRSYIGKIKKRVTISSNDPSHPKAILSFTANIGYEGPVLRLMPNAVVYHSATVSKNEVKKITVLNMDTAPISLALIDRPSNIIDINLKDDNLEPGKSTDMIFKINADSIPPSFDLSATLMVNGSYKYRVTIPMRRLLVAK